MQYIMMQKNSVKLPNKTFTTQELNNLVLYIYPLYSQTYCLVHSVSLLEVQVLKYTSNNHRLGSAGEGYA